MSKFVPYVAHRPDGMVVMHLGEEASCTMNKETARWLANELNEAADRIDKLNNRE